MIKIQSSPQQKIYLLIGGYLAALVLAWFFVVTPLISQIRTDGQELGQKKQEIDNFYQDWQNLEESKTIFRSVQKEMAAQPAFLSAKEPIKFIQYVESVARQSGNYQEIAALAPDKDTPAPQNQLDFQLTTQGGFSNLVKFMIYLENAPYYNEIVSLQIRRLSQKEVGISNRAGSAGDVTGNIRLAVYKEQ